MAERTVLRKDQLEISLHNEKKLIKEGTIKDDNPLDLSEPFRELCSACRKGDLKVCQEKITEGVNVNARDPYDYTPLILVSVAKHTTPDCFVSGPMLVSSIMDRSSNRYIYLRIGQSMRALRSCTTLTRIRCTV